MNSKCIIYSYIFAYVLNDCAGEKLIMFRKIQCEVKSKLISDLECIKDNDTSISFQGTVNNDIVSCYGRSNFAFNVNTIKNELQCKGLRTDFCDSLAIRRQHQLQCLINTGRRIATTNFPQKCPFRRNTTYFMKYMQFDSKFVPNYLPECNFTYFGKLYLNTVLTIEIQATGSVCNIGNDCR